MTNSPDNAQPAPRPVTTAEHDMLMAAARDGMTLVSKGRLVATPTAQAAPAPDHDHCPQANGYHMGEKLHLYGAPKPTAQAAPAAGAVAVPNWRELLQELEWSAGGYNRSGDGESMCPCCEQWKSDWHTSDCRLASMLAAAPTPAAQADSVLEDAAWMPIATAPAAGLILLVVEDSAGERRVFPAEASHENGGLVWMITLGWLGWKRLHSAWTPILWCYPPVAPARKQGGKHD